MSELVVLRSDLDFYMKRCAQLERELHHYKVLFGEEVAKARKSYRERKPQLSRNADNLYKLILKYPGKHTKFYHDRFEGAFGYTPTELSNRVRDLRYAGLIESVVHEEDGLQHHYPKPTEK